MLDGNKTLAVIGCGTMGEAIVRGIFRSGKLAPNQVFATDRRPELVKELAVRHQIRTGADNLEAARAAEVALVCLKPQHMEAALDNEPIRGALANKLVISIAAGVRLGQLETWLPKSQIIRAMPNTPAVIGEGMTIISRGQGVTDTQVAIAQEIFCAVGRCTELDESNMDVITVRCLPGDLVHEIEVDLSKLANIDDHINVSALTPPPGIEFMAEPNDLIIVANAPISEEELAAMDAKPEADVSAVKVATEEKKAERDAAKAEKEGESKE